MTHSDRHGWRLRMVLVWIAAGVGMAGCANRPRVAALAEAAWRGPPDLTAGTESGAGLSADLTYLRVQLNGLPPALMVLGYLDPEPPSTADAPVPPRATWYSARQESLQLVGGRIVATAGLPVNWLSVTMQPGPPAWPDEGGLVRFGRTIEVRGALTDVRAEDVEVVRIASDGVPEWARPTGGDTTRWSRWRWYRETSSASSGCCTATPAGWFAIDPARPDAGPVYSLQCLTAGSCLRIESWPPTVASTLP